MSAPHDIDSPSPWIARWAYLVPPGAAVLDVACGRGRHARYFAARGHPVAAVDRDPEAIAALRGVRGIEPLLADLEAGPWPYPGASFGGVVVANYLHRPLFPSLLDAVGPGGVLIYETFAAGNERYGRPSNPAFLLRPGELLDLTSGMLAVIAFEELRVTVPRPAVVQRICGRRAGRGP